MELRLTATLETIPQNTPSIESLTSPSIPTKNPAITTKRHPIVWGLTLVPRIITLNIALKGIVRDLPVSTR